MGGGIHHPVRLANRHEQLAVLNPSEGEPPHLHRAHRCQGRHCDVQPQRGNGQPFLLNVAQSRGHRD